MLIYFIFFFSNLLIYLYKKHLNNNLYNLFFYLHLILLVVFIGTRNEIGGDWLKYLDNYNAYKTKPFLHVINDREILFSLFSYLFYNLNFKIYFFNSFTAAFCIFSIYKYAKKQFDPILLFIVAMPYIIFVVIMGYNRQGIALSILILSLNYFENKNIKYIFLVLLASLFHTTAIIYLFFIFLKIRFNFKSFLIFIPTLLLISFFSLYLFETDYFIGKWYFYVSDGNYFASTGVYPRALLNLIPALIFLIFYKNFLLKNNLNKLYFTFSLISLFCLPLAVLATSFIDRFLIYFYPIQLYVFSNYNAYFPVKFSKFFIFVIFLFYFIVLFVYFNFGLYSHLWVPYKSYIFNF